ncbi:MAG: hypothetical protein NTY38_07125, partial [Acidobacteria bacterium]|nr:hypothetical protein [Acidobacteriota bacterium]
PEVIGEVVSLIASGIHSQKPEADVVAWDWSWNVIEDDPQSEIIAQLPAGVTLMADFERGTPIERGGRKTLADEYALSIPGPSPRAAAHIRQARARSMKVMAKAQVGCTWELSLLPNIPVLELVGRKFQAMREAGLNGAMESWTLGAYPSLNWDVARMYYGDARPTPAEAVLSATTARYGAEAARRALPAWEIFSRAFSEYPYSNGLVYSSVVQCGPAHMVWLTPTGKRARILHSYDALNWTSPYGPELAARLFRKLGEEWRNGVEVLRAALAGLPAAAGDIRIAEAAGLYFESIANQITIHARRGKEEATELRLLLEDEIRIATRFLALCEADSLIGFEASLQYFCLPLDIREKIAACRYQHAQLGVAR